jgi:hypothetical protein
MSEQLDQAVMEQPMPEVQEAGFMDNVYDFMRKHPMAAKVAVGIGMLGAGGAAELAVADAAAAQPVDGGGATAEISSSSWTVLGGDPLVPGGVHSRSQFVHVITSGKGQTAMKYAGLGAKERQAVTLATREGEERSCNMPYGEHFQRMSFGINGTSVDRDVTFADPDYISSPAAAFCVDAKVDVNNDGKVDEVVHIKMPEACGNIALMNRTPVHHPRHPKPHPKHGNVSVLKIAEDDQGHHIPTPTGTFQFEAKCKVGRNMVDTKAVYNHDPQTLLKKCNVGSVATVTELDPLGIELWKTLSPDVQKQIVRVKGNQFVFKDQEVFPTQPTCEELGTCPPPPPPANHPPVGQLRPPLHEFVNDTEPVCTEGISDPDGDIVQMPKADIKLTDAQGNPYGSIVGNVYDNGPGVKCFVVKAPSTPGQMTITETLTDGKGGDTVLSDNMPIVPDQF